MFISFVNLSILKWEVTTLDKFLVQEVAAFLSNQLTSDEKPGQDRCLVTFKMTFEANDLSANFRYHSHQLTVHKC